MRLRSASSDAWLDAVLADFDAFLIDHAACERKASAAALTFVVRYRDRPVLVGEMIALAREELGHFQQVWELCAERGLMLAADTRDRYVNQLTAQVRHQTPFTRLDRLLVAGIVEARGCERFGRVAEALEAGRLRDFYRFFATAEARHHALFRRLAREDAGASEAERREGELLEIEAKVLAGLPIRPALH